MWVALAGAMAPAMAPRVPLLVLEGKEENYELRIADLKFTCIGTYLAVLESVPSTISYFRELAAGAYRIVWELVL